METFFGPNANSTMRISLHQGNVLSINEIMSNQTDLIASNSERAGPAGDVRPRARAAVRPRVNKHRMGKNERVQQGIELGNQAIEYSTALADTCCFRTKKCFLKVLKRYF